jgi:hypothetical protein
LHHIGSRKILPTVSTKIPDQFKLGYISLAMLVCP